MNVSQVDLSLEGITYGYEGECGVGLQVLIDLFPICVNGPFGEGLYQSSGV